MVKYNPDKLISICTAIIKEINKSNNKRENNYEIAKCADNLKTILFKKAQQEVNSNLTKYKDILLNPYELFYFKQQKTYGFYKEFLEIPNVKKHINKMSEYYINNIKIEELDKETQIFTKGKKDFFNDYFEDAMNNRCEKIINKIAILEAEKIIENLKNSGTFKL